MKANRSFFIWILFVFLTPFIASSTAEQKMERANGLMQQKSYQEAIVQYRELIAEGSKGVSLYNNLGLALYHTGNIPESVLYFERALKLAPGNSEVRHNLEVVRSAIDQDVYPLEKFFLLEWWESFYLSMHPDFFAVVTLLLVFVFLLSMFVLLFRSRTKLFKPARWVAVLVTILIIVFFAAAMKGTRVMKYGDARILMKDAAAFESPDDGSGQSYQLKAGSKVWLKESRDGWFKLELINRDTCWVREVSMEKI